MSIDLDRILTDEAKKESIFHFALHQKKQIQTATEKGDKKLKEELRTKGSFEAIYGESLGFLSLEDDLLQIEDIEKTIKLLERTDFKITRIGDEDFPIQLANYEQCTPILYYQGDLALADTKSIAVIGTREPTQRAIDEANHVMGRLLKQEYTIISGLASGSDTLGHKYAVENGGRTIAVLGTPINKHYPKKNAGLQDRIAKEHLVVSQYPIGIRTFGSYFAHRNRNTIGLSTDGAVIVRSGDKSGTVHAIRECVKQGKRLFVLENNYELGSDWLGKFKGSITLVKQKND